MLKSYQLIRASLLLPLTGKVEFLDFLGQPISSTLPPLPNPAPSPFLHFMAQRWKMNRTTTCSGNQFRETILWSRLF